MTADEDGNDVDDTLCAAELEFKPSRPADMDAGFGAIAGFGGNSVKFPPKKNSNQIRLISNQMFNPSRTSELDG
jgi:hypothetical protein